jgi:hypothetical protein
MTPSPTAVMTLPGTDVMTLTSTEMAPVSLAETLGVSPKAVVIEFPVGWPDGTSLQPGELGLFSSELASRLQSLRDQGAPVRACGFRSNGSPCEALVSVEVRSSMLVPDARKVVGAALDYLREISGLRLTERPIGRPVRH